MQNKIQVSGILFSVPWCHHQLCRIIIVITLFFSFQLKTAFSSLELRGGGGRHSTQSPRRDAAQVPPRSPTTGAPRFCRGPWAWMRPQPPGDLAAPRGPRPVPACRSRLESRWHGGGPRVAQALERSPSRAGPHRPIARRPSAVPCVSRGGGPPRVPGGAGEGLSVSKVSKFKLAFLPRLTPATCATRANGEGKQKLSKVSHKCQCF